jgi:hypothetical protein
MEQPSLAFQPGVADILDIRPSLDPPVSHAG